MEYSDKAIRNAGAALPQQEVDHLIGLVNRALKKQQPGRYSALDLLRLVREGKHSTAFNSLALYLNRLLRDLSLCKSAASGATVTRSLLHLRELLENRTFPQGMGTNDVAPAVAVATSAAKPLSVEVGIAKVYRLSVGRMPAPTEVAFWKKHFDNGGAFHEFLLSMMDSPESENYAKKDRSLLADSSDGEFVQIAFEVMFGRGGAIWELSPWLHRLEERTETRASLLAILFDTAARLQGDADAPAHDGLSCLIMGTQRHLTANEWTQQAEAMQQGPPQAPDTRYANRFRVSGEPRVLVSALASLYRGGEFIEQFMENITSQDGFDDYCELVIVDADSPENEYETIKRYLARHRNINYIRMNYRIGIYDAWNVAAQAARGKYLTNTNLDDLRRHDSFMLQAATLENLPFADVAYQDLYYTFDPRLTFDEIARFGHQTTLPPVTAHNMMTFNSPHNAPMWRRKLHDELGYFDIHYRSAGDYEFWMRCLVAGKKFYKCNDPHAVYYQNPKGLSTRPGTRGIAEAMEISKFYSRKLVTEDVVMPRKRFLGKVGLPEVEAMQDVDRSRYDLAQQALRNLARSRKYPASSGVRA